MDISPINNANVNSSIGVARLDNLKRIAEARPVNKAMDSAERAQLAKAARGFESMFVHMMIKEMKSAMLEENKDAENFGADTLSGYADMLLADDIANTGNGVGIAEKIYSQLSGGEKLEPKTVINNHARTVVNIPLKSVSLNNIPSNHIPLKSVSLNNNLSNHIPLKSVSLNNNLSNHIPLKSVSLNNNLSNNVSGDLGGGNFMMRLIGRLSDYEDYIAGASDKYDVPPSLIKAIITAESAGKFNAVSKAGAKGLMQLMDATAAGLGVDNSFDPEQNIYGGTSYISKMIGRFDGEIELALAAYNAGPGNVMKYGGVPPFPETKAYISRVKKYNEIFANLGDV